MALKLVPFNSTWVNHDKIDVHAIYRRPVYAEDKYGEMERVYTNGIPEWDLTTPLPVRQHNKWLAKGFEYITLANRDSLIIAAKYHTLPPDTSWKDFDQHQTGGPWSIRKYMEGVEQGTAELIEELRADVMEFGSAAVTKIRRRTEPEFKLPAELEGIEPQRRAMAMNGLEGAEEKPKKKVSA